MTSPTPRKRYRDKVGSEMATAHPTTDQARLDAIVDHVWPHALDQARFDELLAAFVRSQRTWWGTPTLRG